MKKYLSITTIIGSFIVTNAFADDAIKCTKKIEQSIYHSSGIYKMKAVSTESFWACIKDNNVTIYDEDNNKNTKVIGESIQKCSPEFTRTTTTTAVLSSKENSHTIKIRSCVTDVDLCLHSRVDDEEEVVKCVNIGPIEEKRI